MSFPNRRALGAAVCLILASCSGGATPTEPVKPSTPSGPTPISLAVSADTVRLDTWGDSARVTATDFNRDGLQDLVMFVIPKPFAPNSAIRMWLNSGDGSFRDVSQDWGLPAECTGEVIEPLDIADINGDGWPDFTVPRGCAALNGSGVFVNQGTRLQYFAFSRIQPWVDGPVTLMDLDRDGDLDLFFGNRGGSNVVVRNPG